jgi:hypothetical protein
MRTLIANEKLGARRILNMAFVLAADRGQRISRERQSVSGASTFPPVDIPGKAAAAFRNYK